MYMLTNGIRLLHYPPCPTSEFKQNERRVRAGAHTDYGSITLLFQDMAGGLQVLSPNNTFVNATPIGTDSDETPVPPHLLRPDLNVLDLVYRPTPTRLVREARKRGATARGGAGALLRQAVASFQLWTGREAPIEVMREALDHELDAAPGG